MAAELGADGFIILTDGGGIWQNFGKPNAREMKKASPGEWLLSVVGMMMLLRFDDVDWESFIACTNDDAILCEQLTRTPCNHVVQYNKQSQ